MPHYLISYDLRKARNYQPLYALLAQWKAARVLESVWLANLKGPAVVVRKFLQAHIDSDDGLVVIELAPNFDWATFRALNAGSKWLQTNSP